MPGTQGNHGKMMIALRMIRKRARQLSDPQFIEKAPPIAVERAKQAILFWALRYATMHDKIHGLRG